MTATGEGSAARRAITTESLESLLAYQLRLAQEASFRAFASRVDDTSMWPGWYALLAIISDNPLITPTELSIASKRDKSTLTASLRELSKAGLVGRRRDPRDGRSFGLFLTPSGSTHLASLERHAQAHNRQLDRIVGDKGKLELLSILRKIVLELGRTER